MDRDDWPSLAECQRDEAEAACARHGHVLGEDEDGEVLCDRCGERAFYDAEPPAEGDEPEPTDEQRQAWAQADLDRIRLTDLGREAA